MADREVLANPVNSPQPVTWYIPNYYPTNAAGQTPTIVGGLFYDYGDAVAWGRTQLADAGVGVVYIEQVQGTVMFPLFAPTPS